LSGTLVIQGRGEAKGRQRTLMSRYADVVRTSRFGSDCPGLGRLAVMANAGFPEPVLEMGEVQAIAKTIGIEVSSLERLP
jgi:hypothetical protein